MSAHRNQIFLPHSFVVVWNLILFCTNYYYEQWAYDSCTSQHPCETVRQCIDWNSSASTLARLEWLRSWKMGQPQARLTESETMRNRIRAHMIMQIIRVRFGHRKFVDWFNFINCEILFHFCNVNHSTSNLAHCLFPRMLIFYLDKSMQSEFHFDSASICASTASLNSIWILPMRWKSHDFEWKVMGIVFERNLL